MNVTRAVPDAYALYAIALGCGPAAARLRERTAEGDLTLLVTAGAMTIACAMPACGAEDCDRVHPVCAGPQVADLCRLPGAEFHPLSPDLAVAAGALYQVQTRYRYLGDTVLAACSTAALAHVLGLPILTTARSRYCYATGVLDASAPRFEIDVHEYSELA